MHPKYVKNNDMGNGSPNPLNLLFVEMLNLSNGPLSNCAWNKHFWKHEKFYEV